MIDCIPEEQPDGVWRCVHCGYARSHKFRRNCTSAAALPCVDRGEQTRRATCTFCGARDRIVAVFACELHGECTATPCLKGVASCRGCTDREPA